jgi:putative cardiolipin synthase
MLNSGVRYAVLLLLIALTGCASLPTGLMKKTSAAIATPQDTALGKVVLASAPAGQVSGFRLLPAGPYAYDTRIALIRRAQRSLDLQYYVINKDDSGQTLLKELTDAATRGVRVRLLIDDFFTSGQDAMLLSLALQPNIEVRLFNPFAGGRASLLTRLFSSAWDLKRISHRMHNKLFIADNAMAVTGGRNIGDEYFMYAAGSNFIDMDVLAAGAVVRELSGVFDGYWNSDYVYPIEALVSAGEMKKGAPYFEITTSRSPLAQEVRDPLGYGPLACELEAGKLDLIWAPASVFADSPSKVAGVTEDNLHGTVSSRLLQVMGTATTEVLVASPYFVPGKVGMAAIRKLHARGIRMVLLTNSLAATDAPLVYVAYARYRREMLKEGVIVYEISPMRAQKRGALGSFGSSRAMLHAKIAVVDRKQLFIGSMNSDARSARENTEMGLVIQSPELAQQIVQLMAKDGGASSHLVRLADKPAGIEWVARDGDIESIDDDEPDVPFFLKFKLWLFASFAPEELL